MHEELLLRLFEEDVMELLLLVAQHAGQRPFRGEVPLLLDIFWEIFKRVEPEALVQVCGSDGEISFYS